jgi:hypothetical protein
MAALPWLRANASKLVQPVARCCGSRLASSCSATESYCARSWRAAQGAERLQGGAVLRAGSPASRRRNTAAATQRTGSGKQRRRLRWGALTLCPARGSADAPDSAARVQ